MPTIKIGCDEFLLVFLQERRHLLAPDLSPPLISPAPLLLFLTRPQFLPDQTPSSHQSSYLPNSYIRTAWNYDQLLHQEKLLLLSSRIFSFLNKYTTDQEYLQSGDLTLFFFFTLSFSVITEVFNKHLDK